MAQHNIYLLPDGMAAAAENMAMDWLMLEAFPEPDAARLRFYGWTQPAFTFGYGQKWTEARARCAAGVELVRRPTGGGLVDHQNDWTYALVLPAAHRLAQVRACESYRAVHRALATTLLEAGVSCRLQVANCKQEGTKFAACFEQAETFDVIRVNDGRKIAGAAQKRAKRGMLLQGSVERSRAGEIQDWKALGKKFAEILAGILPARLERWDGLAWTPEEWREAAERFGGKAWNEKR